MNLMNNIAKCHFKFRFTENNKPKINYNILKRNWNWIGYTHRKMGKKKENALEK